ncbi:hypothetical protein [Nocardiopsis dassonvillei]
MDSKDVWERLKLNERTPEELRDLLAYLSGYAPDAVNSAMKTMWGEG